MLNNIDTNDDSSTTKSFKKFLKKKLDAGFEYIVIDAQHRIKLFAEYVNGMTWDNSDNPFRQVSGTLPVHIDLEDELGDKQEDVGKKAWDDIGEDHQNWFLDQWVLVVIIVKSSHTSLRKLFIGTNDGVPVSEQDKRNCGDSPIVEHIRNIANHQLVLDHLFNKCNYKGSYDIRKRGHELIASQLLLFEKNRAGDLGSKKSLDGLFFMENNKTYTAVIPSVKKKHIKNMNELAKVCKYLKKDFLGKKGRLYNLYILISLISDNQFHTHKKSNGLQQGNSYTINNYQAFADWFAITELTREEEDRYWYIVDKDNNFVLDEKGNKQFMYIPGTTKKAPRQDSYNDASHDSRNTNSTDTIMNRLMRDFKEELSRIQNLGYIKLEGKAATKAQKQTTLVSSGFRDAFSGEMINPNALNSDIEFDHIVPKSDGGTGDGNLRPISKKANRQRSNKKLLRDS